MPYDRRTIRVLLAMISLVGVAVSVGCMRSSNLRSSAGALPELSPAGELHPVPGEPTPGSPSPAPATSWARNAVPSTPRPSFDPGASPDRPAMGPSQGGSAATPAPPGGTDQGNPPASPTRPTPSPAPVGERPTPPANSPTPLLDAEIRRAEAVTRQQIESLQAVDPPAPVINPIVTPTAQPESTPAPADPDEPKPIETRPANPGRDEPTPEILAPLPLSASLPIATGSETAGATGGITVPPLIPIDPPANGSASLSTVPPLPNLTTDDPAPPASQPAAIADAPDPAHRAEESTPSRPEPGDTDDPKLTAPQTGEGTPKPPASPTAADREGRPTFRITALRLCSKVNDFGSVVPRDPNALKPGHPVLVYCEIAGLEYQRRGDAYVSRVAAHLELRSGVDGPVIWQQAMGIAEDDRNPRPRLHYFVSYKIEWPGSLEPGDYRLRLIQTDLIGNRAASEEIPVAIVR